MSSPECGSQLSGRAVGSPGVGRSKSFSPPKSVEFFSREGTRLGDKASLMHSIYEITGIPTDALQGCQLSEFSVAVRFSWTTNRRTTREEDEAYCLLGIFGTYMSLIYGEGKDNAIKRLQNELRESEQVGQSAVNDTQSRSKSHEE
jgi:hypothetical protein